MMGHAVSGAQIGDSGTECTSRWYPRGAAAASQHRARPEGARADAGCRTQPLPRQAARQQRLDRTARCTSTRRPRWKVRRCGTGCRQCVGRWAARFDPEAKGGRPIRTRTSTSSRKRPPGAVCKVIGEDDGSRPSVRNPEARLLHLKPIFARIGKWTNDDGPSSRRWTS